MSVVFTTISDKFIAICADKSRPVPIIEKWAPHIAVGMSGDLTMGEYVRSSVHQFVTESGISNFGPEEIADLLVQTCNSYGEESRTETKFIIAGKLSDKNLGAVVIRASGGAVDTEIFRAANMPATLILEPSDLSVDRCNMLFGKALKNVEGKFLKNPLESIHRRAVRNVSEHSNLTSKEADYILIIP